jgi:hypothetical protein
MVFTTYSYLLHLLFLQRWKRLKRMVTLENPLPMLVNLPNGKTVDMSFEDYLRAGVEDYGYLMSHNYGADMEDPFFGSILHSRQIKDEDTSAEENDEDEDDAITGCEMRFEE